MAKRVKAVEVPTVNVFNLASQISTYEAGELDHEDTVELFQHLIDTGMAWTLQGSYGRTAMDLLEAGECQNTPQGRKAYFKAMKSSPY